MSIHPVNIYYIHVLPSIPQFYFDENVAFFIQDCFNCLYFSQITNETAFFARVIEYLGYGYLESHLHHIAELTSALLRLPIDINFRFEKIHIKGSGVYQYVTPLHVVYLYWQSLKRRESPFTSHLERVFLQFLNDPRTDLHARFSELDRELDTDYCCDYLIETTLAHYALMHDDLETCHKLLSLSPNLMSTTCKILSEWDQSQKALQLEGDLSSRFDSSGRYDWDQLSVISYPQLNFPWTYFRKDLRIARLAALFFSENQPRKWVAVLWSDNDNHTRSTYAIRYHEISLLHLAAKRLNEGACGFLTAHIDPMNTADSARRTVLDWVEIYHRYAEGSQLEAKHRVLKLLKEIRPLPRSLRSPYHTLEREGYTAFYNAQTKCSIVYQKLYASSFDHLVPAPRSGFRQDPLIPEINRIDSHILSGHPSYVRGHLAPHADFLSSSQAVYDAGYLTNIVPQDAEFNNTIWKKIENRVRELARQFGCVEVFTGGIFTSDPHFKGPKWVTYEVVGTREMSVPTHLFKVVLSPYGLRMGWLVPNRKPDYDQIEYYSATIERIQELSGIPFNR